MMSRRQLLYFSVLFSLCYPLTAKLTPFAWGQDLDEATRFRATIDILKEAFWAERSAHTRYLAFGQKALADNFPNIAYLFTALDVSEKIHADNYQTLITRLGDQVNDKEYPLTVEDTKKNLNTAAHAEMAKITVFYPDVIDRLSVESHDEAILNCMYSWKSHQQHEQIIREIKKYSGFFFKLLAQEIEERDPDYYVCEVCGSTINDVPEAPCEICNYAMTHYQQIPRPTLVSRAGALPGSLDAMADLTS